MPTISIVTAVLAGLHEHLPALYDSLAAQRLPAGWDWEWIVQEDGETGEPAQLLPPDPRIRPGIAPHGRAAVARTVGLGRATGLLTRAVDADDLLVPGALACDITEVTTHPGVGWCVSAVVDLLEDGAQRPGPRDPAPGPARPGMFREANDAGWPLVLGTTLCAYTELIHLLGGWPALPTIEDVALLLAAEAVSPGRIAPGVSLLYRRWSGASTMHIVKAGPQLSDARYGPVLQARLDALTRSGLRWAPPALPVGGDAGAEDQQMCVARE